MERVNQIEREIELIDEVLGCVRTISEEYANRKNSVGKQCQAPHFQSHGREINILFKRTERRRKSRQTVLISCFLNGSWQRIENYQQQANEFRCTNPLFSRENQDSYLLSWTELFDKIQKRFHAKGFVLNYCFFDNRFAKLLTDRFKDVIELWLGTNNIGDEGVDLIVKNMNNLQILSLASNKATEVGSMNMARNLTQTIKKLYLTKSVDITIDSIIGIVVNHPNLVHLSTDLSANRRVEKVWRMLTEMSCNRVSFNN